MIRLFGLYDEDYVGIILFGAFIFAVVMLISGLFGSIQVIDGDTIEKGDTTYRLSAIDAPELGECFHDEATDQLRNLITQGSKVKLVKLGKDKYGRTLATLYVNGVNINDELVKNGYAFTYYGQGNDLSSQEHAEEFKLGLWSKCQPHFNGIEFKS